MAEAILPNTVARYLAGASALGSGALVVEDLAERVQDLDEVGLVGHDLIDVLVGRGDLVHQRLGPVGQPHLALHLVYQVGGGEQLLGLGPAVAPAGTVRARRPALLTALAGHDVAAGPHRTGDHSQVTHIGLESPLAGDPQPHAGMYLALGEVVVAVDAPRLPAEAEEGEHLAHGVVHHLVPVGAGVVLGPQHVGDVGPELGGALHEVGQVGVLQPQLQVLGQPAGLADVRLGQLVADPAAARV